MTDTTTSQPETAPGAEQTFQQALQQTLQQGRIHHQAGQLQQAEQHYRAILQAEPQHPEANHHLGVLAVETQQPVAGLPHFEVALAARPESARYWLSYIEALFQASQTDLAQQMLALGRQHGLEGEAAEALAQKLKVGQRNAEPSAAEQKITLGAIPRALPTPAQHRKKKLESASPAKPVAKALQRNGGRRQPKPQKMNTLVGLFNQERYAEAEIRARNVTEQFPHYGFGWNLLGAALQQQGRSAEALGSMQKAVRLSPGDAEGHSNLGNVLRDLRQLDEAMHSYRRALKIKPDYAEAHNNLGNALRDLGQIDNAIASYRHALKLAPDYAMALNNLGAVLQDCGQLEEAVTCLRRAVEIKPDFDMALNNLALVFNAQGKAMTALNTVCRSLRIRETANAKRIFVDCLVHLRLKLVGSDVRVTLVRALSEPWGRPSDLAPSCIYLLKHDPHIGEAVARVAQAWPRRLAAQDLFGPQGIAAVAADPLLCALLDSAPICDIELERFLTMARHALLSVATGERTCGGVDDAVLNFYGALARQCFINEYVFAWTDEEAKQALSLRDAMAASLKAEAEIPALWPLAVAAYFPLHRLALADRLAARTWPDAVSAVLAQQVQEPAQERNYRTTIPCLTSVEDEVSLLVQHQYEENPYPRWIKTAPAGKALTIDNDVRHHFPLTPFRSPAKGSGADILIAGCGTGQQSIETAQRYPAAQVLAVDLSCSSLCYAKRKTHALGVTSIEYAQADILKLGMLGRSFDFIVCTGVLHHLDDPLAGWRVLLSLLRPGGFMHLAFYSELARRDIVRARAFIVERGYASTAEDIRRCRQDLANFDANAGFGSVLKSSDFFSISACRDLLFHVQEHRLTLPGIAAFLRDNGLQFLGFQLDAPVLRAFQRRYPDDLAGTNLDHWQRFESENPDTFFGMYQFWVQKVD